MSNIWKKYNQHLVGLILVSIFWISIQFGIMSIISMIHDKSNLIEEKTLDRQNREKRIQELPRLREQFEMVVSEENKLEVLIKNEDELVLIESLEKIAESTGNKIAIQILDSIKKENEKKKKEKEDENKNDEKETIKPANENNLVIQVTLSGKYNNLIDFMKKVENMKYWSDIISLDLKYGESAEYNREGDIFSSGRKTDSDAKQVIPEKSLNSKMTIIFYRK